MLSREIGGYANGEVINEEAYLRNRCDKKKILFKRVPGHMDRRSNTYMSRTIMYAPYAMIKSTSLR